MMKLLRNLCDICIFTYRAVKAFFISAKKPFVAVFGVDNKVFIKVMIIVFLFVLLITESAAWFYNEYISSGALFEVGELTHQVKMYDESGVFIEDLGELSTVVYENNMSVTTKSSKFIEVSNVGTLDMEYDIAFQLDGTINEAGVMYYRLYEVTSEVEASVIEGEFDTKLKAYANNNPIPANIESDTVRPVTNMSTIGNFIQRGSIRIENESTDPNPRYYRLDYGMYEATNSSLFTDKAIAVHTSVYSTQIGQLSDTGAGQIWVVNNETEFRMAIEAAAIGDTLRAGQSFTIDGNVNFYKHLNLDLAGNQVTITGDFVLDYVEVRNLLIDVSGSGRLEVNNNFTLNTPKTNIHIVGGNQEYDIYVGGEFKINSVQDLEQNGAFLENVRIVQNTTTNMPADIIMMSNSRLTIGHDVIVGFVKTNMGATNIELINNGSIVQIQFQDMALLSSFTKPQIYIYNLATIHGVVDGASIVLPSNATPYLSPTQGNTLIIKGINSSDITVEGSEHFSQDDIGQTDDDGSVIPIQGEENAYIVYLSEPEHTIENVLTNYFVANLYQDVLQEIFNIEKIIVRTVNAQYVENHDFDYMRSASMGSLNFLSLETARVKDGEVLNRIKSGALQNKAILKTVLLPETLTAIGADAFAGVSLGHIPASPANPFNFLKIPANVSNIETGAFDTAKYVRFDGAIVPTVAAGAFNSTDSGAKIFVGSGFVDTYRNSSHFNEKNIFRTANLSDNRLYFVYDSGDGVGISLSINPAIGGTTIGIPTTINYNTYTLPVNDIGPSAFRQVNVDPAGASLVLPSTVRGIGSYAFHNLKITSANLQNIVNFGDYAFQNNEITTLNLTNADTIGKYTFANSLQLQEINFFEIRNIGDYAFYDSKNVARVNFNSTDTRVVNNNEEINLNFGTESVFSNWGQYLDGRLRVYVPAGSITSGETYLELYKEKFAAHEHLIFEQGIFVGEYYHYAVPYNLYEYTVKVVTIDDANGVPTTGYEIISYQGADLVGGYSIPLTLTANDTTLPVVSIGQNAYRHVPIATAAQINLTMPNILSIGAYSFYNHPIVGISADNAVKVYESAFANSGLRTASFDNLIELGDNALANITHLNFLDLGTVKTIGSNAVSNAVNLFKLYINNDDLDITANSNSFTDLGLNTNNRMRIYVPVGDPVITYYKALFSQRSTFVYTSGLSVGTYTVGGVDIGEYTVRAIDLQSHTGGTVGGYEIIDYHGANLASAYNIPNELTVSSVTLPVISIGRDAYINTEITESNIVNLSQNSVINIGRSAFAGVDGIGTVSMNGATTIGTRAFENTTITQGEFPNLNSISTLAFSNVSTLYSLDLGTVKSMATSSVQNAGRLYQVFFEAEDLNINFHSNAFDNVGSLTNEKIRFYVTDDLAITDVPFFEVYRSLFDATYHNYFFPRGHLIGSYTPLGVPFDIAEYSLRPITLTNHNNNPTIGWELVEYHGTDLTNSYSIPATVLVGSDNYNIIGIGNRAYQFTNAIPTAEIEINHFNLIRIGNNAFRDLSGIKDFIAPGVVTIGDSAFRNSSLKIAEFENLKSAASHAFANNSQLNKIDLGFIETVGASLLYENTALHQVFINNISSSGTNINITIGQDAFYNVGTAIGGRFRIYVPDGTGSGDLTYTTLYKNTLPSTVSQYIFPGGMIVGSYIHYPFDFDMGAYNVREVTMTDPVDMLTTGLEIIGYHGADITTAYTIPYSFNIESVDVPVISIGDQAYRNAQVEANNTWTIAFPHTVFHVGDYAFHGRNINMITGNLFTYIGEHAFENVSGLEWLEINGCRVFGEYSFHNNPSLEYIYIGTGITTIGNYSFYVSGANALHSFYIEEPTPPIITNTTLPAPNAGLTIYTAWDSWQTYRNAPIWGSYNVERNRIAYLGIYLYEIINGNEIRITGFSGQHNTLTIPEYFNIDDVDYPVTEIADGTFETAGNMRGITLPAQLSRIPNDFLGTNNRMRDIFVNGSNPYFSSIGGVLFDKTGAVLLRFPADKNTTNYTLPASTRVINTNAFSRVLRVTTLNLNANLLVISKDAFENNTVLRTYNFNSTTPPYITAFNVFPMHPQLSINVPGGSLANYQNYFALQRYRNYISD